MYNLEHLKMLVITVETGSFSACARKLGKVQSAVSQGIAALEDDLNLVLFDRSTRKPSLTAEGARVLEFARAILLHLDDLEVAAEALQQGEETVIRLAVDPALWLPQTNDILNIFEQKYPMTELEIMTSASPDISEILKRGRADIGVIFSEIEIDKEIEHCYIGNLAFYAVCAPDHPLTHIERIQMGDLLPHRQILLRGEMGAGLDLFPKMSRQAWYINNFYALSDMIQAGFGWGYIPAHFVDELGMITGFHRLNFSFDHKPWSPPVELVRQKQFFAGPAASWLFEALKSLLEE